MTLGERLIAELGRRGHRGRYFDYQGYQTLREIDSPEALRAFLAEQGYDGLTVADDMANLVWQLDRLSPGLLDVPLVTLGVGTAMGFVAFAFAMLVLPSSPVPYGEVDAQLAQNLAIIFPLMLGFWSGFVQQSLRAIFVGVGVGAAVGGAFRLLAAHSLPAAIVVGLALLGGLVARRLKRCREPWLRWPPSQAGGGWAVFGVLVGALTWLIDWGLCLAEVQATAPTPWQYRQALWLLGLGGCPLAGVFLLLWHWAIGLRHPEGGPHVAFGLSYRHTPGLERVTGDPQRVWEAVRKRVIAEDAHFRKRRWIYAVVLWVVVVLFWMLFLPLPGMGYWKTYLLCSVPPHLAVVLRHMKDALPLPAVMVFLFGFQAVWQQRLNARVAEELQKYPGEITLEAIQSPVDSMQTS